MASRGRTGSGGAGRALGIVLRARPLTAIALLLGVLYLPWIAALPLDGTLEGNRLEAAREMLRSGDWMIPRLGGAVYLAKPPLHPWTLALASLPSGELTLGLGRGVSALATIAACCLVFAWGRRELGTRTGAFAALALGAAVACVQKAVRAELESVLLLLTTLALLALWRAGRSASRRDSIGASLASGLALGAAVLTKGPSPLVVFLAAAISACAARERRRSFLPATAIALAVGLACVLAWLVPVCARLGVDEVRRTLDEQLLERITHAGHTNAEPAWFYVPALLAALLPASLLAPSLVLVRPGRGEDERARGRAAFLWGWALVPLVVFSLSSGKETRYLLPTLPAWTLLLAWGTTRARVARRFAGWRHGLARALALATWVAPFAWLLAGWRLFPQHVAVVALSAAGALLACASLACSRRPAAALGSLVLLIGMAKLAWSGTVVAEKQRHVPVAEVGRSIASRLAPGESWILVGPYRSWWHFAVDRPCVSVADWNELRRARSASEHYALAPASAIPDGEELERVDSWILDGEAYSLVHIPGGLPAHEAGHLQLAEPPPRERSSG